MQLTRIANANSMDSRFTASMIESVDVKILASLSGNAITTNQKIIPTIQALNNDTDMANLAAFALPAPSSFATRTLSKNVASQYI